MTTTPNRVGEEEQKGGDAVDAEAVVDVEAPHPDEVLDELEARRLAVELEEQHRGEHPRRQRARKGDDLVELGPTLAQHDDDERRRQRQVGDDREGSGTLSRRASPPTPPRPSGSR